MSFTLSQPAHSELLIKKSRFIGCVQPVADRAAALAVVASLRSEHPAAAHVCWALMAGGQQRFASGVELAMQPRHEVERCWCQDLVEAWCVRPPHLDAGRRVGGNRERHCR